MRKSFFSTISFVLLAVFLSSANSVLAQARAYRVSDRQVQTLINRIETNSDTFRRQLDRSLDRSSLNGTSSEDDINRYIADFERATDSLRSKFDSRRSVSSDVEEVLNRANFINGFLSQNRLDNQVQRSWTTVRTDLNLLANYYNVSWSSWSTTIPVYSGGGGSTVGGGSIPYRVTDNQVRNLLTRIEQRADNFKNAVDRSLDRSTLNNTASEDSINRYMADFERATDNLRSRFDARTSAAADVEEVLSRAQVIEGFMRDYRLNNAATNQWSLLRTDLSTLATYYNVSWNWNSTNMPGTQYGMSLTGTYQLNRSQSDNLTTVIDASLRSGGGTSAQNDRIRRNLERRLASPDTLVVENRNNQITIASNLSQPVTFAADGVRRSETNQNGRTVNVRVAPVGSGVEVAYEGDRSNDFFLTFMPMNNGQLRVTRRLYLENRNQTVTVNSVYDKVSPTANFSNIPNSNIGQNNSNYPNNNSISNDFVVPNGTQLTAVLSSTLSTQNMNDGDRFRMEVSSPSQYSGAIIEGYVSNVQKSGRVSGRAETTFNFDTIQLRNGNTYRFSGIIDQVRQPNGDTVSVNNEGAVREGSQTTKTVTRAGIGAAIGAIIGAIAGGGSGAAIGAGIGAGAGAGTVILQGRDNLELRQGAEVRITSSAPNNLRAGY